MKNALLFIVMSFVSTVVFAAHSGPAINNPIVANLAQITNWKKLGAKKVNFRLDRDVVRVGFKKGQFKKLKIQVTRGSLNMHKMVVEFKNGEKQTIELKHQFKKGKGSRIIDLEGGERYIKDITFWYDSKNKSKNRATVHVFGKK